MDYLRRKCFLRGGYQLDTERVIMQFSDTSIYAFDGLTQTDWALWKNAYPHGTYFNLEYRNTDIEYNELVDYPTDLVNELIEIPNPI